MLEGLEVDVVLRYGDCPHSLSPWSRSGVLLRVVWSLGGEENVQYLLLHDLVAELGAELLCRVVSQHHLHLWDVTLYRHLGGCASGEVSWRRA